jgi:hypothetical protein
VRRYTELQPVFAVAFLVVVARGTLASTELAMTVMAMSAAFGVFCRPKVAHWSFLRLIFVHITLPFFSNVWVVSVMPNIFSLRPLTAKV